MREPHWLASWGKKRARGLFCCQNSHCPRPLCFALALALALPFPFPFTSAFAVPFSFQFVLSTFAFPSSHSCSDRATEQQQQLQRQSNSSRATGRAIKQLSNRATEQQSSRPVDQTEQQQHEHSEHGFRSGHMRLRWHHIKQSQADASPLPCGTCNTSLAQLAARTIEPATVALTTELRELCCDFWGAGLLQPGPQLMSDTQVCWPP
jgi:hypothetical protein